MKVPDFTQYLQRNQHNIYFSGAPKNSKDNPISVNDK
jgi:hypothetical protein